MFNNDDNSILWFLILFALAANRPSSESQTSTEDICKAFTTSIDKYFEEHKELTSKARVNSPLWQLSELRKAADGIEDINIKCKVLCVAMSIIDNLKATENFSSVFPWTTAPWGFGGMPF